MADTKQVVCPSCSALNRVLADRIYQNPACGKCHAPLLPGKPLNLDSSQLTRRLSKSDMPVLVDFWASWCGPCKMMAPAFEQAAAKLHPKVQLAKVNTEQEQALAAAFGIQSVPTIVLFKNGKEAARISGAMNADAITQWAAGNL